MKSYSLPDADKFAELNKALGREEHTLLSDELDTPYRIPEHHANFGLAYMLRGTAKLRVNHQHVQTKQDTFFLINKESKFALDIQQTNTHPILLYFQKDTPGHIASSLYYSSEKLIEEPSVPYQVDFSLIERLHFATPSIISRIKLLDDLSESCSSFYALKADAAVRSILEELLIENADALKESLRLNVVKKSTRIEIVRRLYYAREWLDANYLNPVQLSDVADVANLNSQHFLRLFKQLFQESPHQYLIRLRIDEAKRLLSISSMTISEICTKLGWESLASFSKTFKQRVGLNPTEFRRSFQGG